MIEFIKMHGLGNDFIVLDARASQTLVPRRITAHAAQRLADRHFGIGCDQVLIIRSSTEADLYLEIVHSDGSHALACGNGTRCVADYVMDTKMKTISIETASGVLKAWRDQETGDVAVDMGPVKTDWYDVPLSKEMNTLCVDLGENAPAPAICHSIGNPHAVMFVDDVQSIDLKKIGPILEKHPLFPEKANISFAHKVAKNRLRMRIWERGVGITLACGSGACAVGVAAFRAGYSGRINEIVMDGGVVKINWQDDGTKSGRTIMQGPTTFVFRGHIEEDFSRHLWIN